MTWGQQGRKKPGGDPSRDEMPAKLSPEEIALLRDMRKQKASPRLTTWHYKEEAKFYASIGWPR